MEKNEEMTKQMEEIYREHNDPEAQARKRAKRKKEERFKETVENLGL